MTQSSIKSDTEAKAAWLNDKMFGLSLLLLYIDAFQKDANGKDQECLYWDPITIQMEIEQEYGIEVPTGNFNRLMAAIGLMLTDNFYHSVTDFCHICVVLSGHTPPSGLMVLPDCLDLSWGITESVLIMPPDKNNEEPFSKEITAYIGQVLENEGILNPPDILRIATHDPNLVSRIHHDWLDDPDMFTAMYQSETDKTNDINQAVMSRTVQLLQQLSTLPLHDRKFKESAESVVERMMAKLPPQSNR